MILYKYDIFQQTANRQAIPLPHTPQYCTTPLDYTLRRSVSTAVSTAPDADLHAAPVATHLEQELNVVLALGDLGDGRGESRGALHQLRLLVPRDLRRRRRLDAALHRDERAVLVRQDLGLLGELRSPAAWLLLASCK